MSRFKAGSMSGDELISTFGLQQGSDVGEGFNAGAGATDGNQTKGNAQLGDGYLTNENYEKLKNDSKVKDAYASIHGQEAMEKKFKDGGISINTMDALFDKLTTQAKEEKAAKEAAKPIQYSPEAAEAKSYTEAFETDFIERQGDFLIKNDQTVKDDFNKAYEFNMQQYSQPQTPEVLADAEARRAERRKSFDASNFANNAKKNIADGLIPVNRT